MNISVSRLERPEQCGDWHDKPVRWVVDGPGTERQKFTTRKEAERYASCRRKSANEAMAQRMWLVREGAVYSLFKVTELSAHGQPTVTRRLTEAEQWIEAQLWRTGERCLQMGMTCYQML